jgi:hypothetical protein
VLTAWDVTAPDDSVVARHALSIVGERPMLRPEPALPASALLPERVRPSRARFLTKGIVFSVLTVALASSVRSDEALRDEFGTDGRAYLVGGAMLAGVGTLFFREKERPIPENVTANMGARAEHDRRIADIIAENGNRLRGYGVTAHIAREPR